MPKRPRQRASRAGPLAVLLAGVLAGFACFNLLGPHLRRDVQCPSGFERTLRGSHALPKHSWRDNFAFMVITGVPSAQRRVSMQLLTFLPNLKNYILVGDAPDAIGEVKVLDVATSVYEQLAEQREAVAAAAEEAGSSDATAGGGGAAGGSRRRRRRLRWQTDEGQPGFLMNRYKSIPGWVELQRQFPRASWYISIDDDSYWFAENFRAWIAKFDARQPLYMGHTHDYFGTRFAYESSVNNATGDSFQEGNFAHGGEGIIMSRAALHKFVMVHQRCITSIVEAEYGDSDIQTALCLQLAGVELSDAAVPSGAQLNEPPGLVNKDAEDAAEGLALQWPMHGPCTPVFSVHHLLPHHVQAAFRAEQAAPAQRPTYSELWWQMRATQENYTAETHLQLDDVYLEGLTLEAQRVGDEQSCLEACEQHARCVQWTYNLGSATCQLKEHFGDVMCSEDPGVVISGALLERFRCRRNGVG